MTTCCVIKSSQRDALAMKTLPMQGSLDKGWIARGNYEAKKGMLKLGRCVTARKEKLK